MKAITLVNADDFNRTPQSTMPLARQLRILLLKPFQHINAPLQAPPLGLLYIVSSIRQKLGEYADIRVIDMKLHNMEPESILHVLQEYDPDVVGFSALNYEAYAGHQIAKHTKAYNPSIITVFGGPYALKNASTILDDKNIDWVFEGAADRSFPEALERIAQNRTVDENIPGLSFRRKDGSVFVSTRQDQINDLDNLPPPAWDLVDLDAYAKKPNMAANLKGKRYAMLFTSRGCPYLCNYCHDIFSKKFVYHSVDYVIAEIERLYEQYGVDEFQIVDDIFNLHKPRLKAIMAEVQKRWPGKLKFAFPNGLRADILDEEVINALCDAGTYAVCVAIETVTPRLQELVEKHLDIEKTRHAIALFGKRNIQITGFFMLGFPTETKEEIQATIDFAIESDLTLAFFFSVVPQFGTPLYDLAISENEEITKKLSLIESGTYRNSLSWYQRSYNYPLANKLRIANIRFYFSPRRILKILRHWNMQSLLRSLKVFLRILVT
ncbi:MAG TPA: radical SAM protein [Pseudomonadales bacterium]|nr:radical SAM protein [Pseudomonadales bacterium]